MFVATSICAASRATLLTGLYERGHRFTFGTPPIARRLLRDELSRPACASAGYRTGFDRQVRRARSANGMTDQMFDTFHDLFRNPYFKTQAGRHARHLTEITGDLAIEFLRDGNRDARPPSAWPSASMPRTPRTGTRRTLTPGPRAVDGLYDDLEMPPPVLADPAIFESQPEFLRESMNRDRWYWRWDTPEKYQKNMRAYFRMISGVDRAIGRVLDELERLGLSGQHGRSSSRATTGITSASGASPASGPTTRSRSGSR